MSAASTRGIDALHTQSAPTRRRLGRDGAWCRDPCAVRRRDIAPAIPLLAPHTGKAALAGAPRLPDNSTARQDQRRCAGGCTDGASCRQGRDPPPPTLRSRCPMRDWCCDVLPSFTREKPAGFYREGKGSILIFRVGSLGDTVVALPCFHRVAGSFPNAPGSSHQYRDIAEAATVGRVIGNSGLVQEVVNFPGRRCDCASCCRCGREFAGRRENTRLWC
jgi:hypothetical protein